MTKMLEENNAVSSAMWALTTLLIIAIIAAALYFGEVFNNYDQQDINSKTPVTIEKPS